MKRITTITLQFLVFCIILTLDACKEEHPTFNDTKKLDKVLEFDQNIGEVIKLHETDNGYLVLIQPVQQSSYWQLLKINDQYEIVSTYPTMSYNQLDRIIFLDNNGWMVLNYEYSSLSVDVYDENGSKVSSNLLIHENINHGHAIFKGDQSIYVIAQRRNNNTMVDLFKLDDRGNVILSKEHTYTNGNIPYLFKSTIAGNRLYVMGDVYKSAQRSMGIFCFDENLELLFQRHHNLGNYKNAYDLFNHDGESISFFTNNGFFYSSSEEGNYDVLNLDLDGNVNYTDIAQFSPNANNIHFVPNRNDIVAAIDFDGYREYNTALVSYTKNGKLKNIMVSDLELRFAHDIIETETGYIIGGSKLFYDNTFGRSTYTPAVAIVKK